MIRARLDRLPDPRPRLARPAFASPRARRGWHIACMPQARCQPSDRARGARAQPMGKSAPQAPIRGHAGRGRGACVSRRAALTVVGRRPPAAARAVSSRILSARILAPPDSTELTRNDLASTRRASDTACCGSRPGTAVRLRGGSERIAGHFGGRRSPADGCPLWSVSRFDRVGPDASQVFELSYSLPQNRYPLLRRML